MTSVFLASITLTESVNAVNSELLSVEWRWCLSAVYRFTWSLNISGVKITSFAVSIWRIFRRTRHELSLSFTSLRGQTTRFRRRRKLCSTLEGSSSILSAHRIKFSFLRLLHFYQQLFLSAASYGAAADIMYVPGSVCICLCRLCMQAVFTWKWLRYVRFFAIANPSVICLSVCNVRAPYSGGWNFYQYFFAILYLWPLCKILRRLSQLPWRPPSGHSGALNTRAV